MGPKKLKPENIFDPKILVLKIFGPKKILGLKEILVPKQFLGSKNILDPKKIFGPKTIWVKKSFRSKIDFW